MAIKGFRDKRLAALWAREIPKRFPAELAALTRRKLVMLDVARSLTDLRTPPANHLEALKGDRAGQYSVRIKDQFRLCFRWTDDGPDEVEFIDYH